MAKVSPISVISGLSGKISSKEKVVFRTRNGKTTMYTINSKPSQPTEAQLRYRELFSKAAEMAKADLLNPERSAYWTKVVEDSEGRYHSPFFAAHAFFIAELKKQK